MSRAASRYTLAAVFLLIMTDVAAIGLMSWFFQNPYRFDDSAARQEAEDYTAYREQFGPAQLGPEECRTETDLRELEAALAGPLKPPAKYAVRWKRTPAVMLYQKWVTDLAQYRRYQQELFAMYRRLDDRGHDLLLARHYDSNWLRKTTELLTDSSKLPPCGPVPGSEALPIPRGAALSFAAVCSSDLVEQARETWNATAWRLTGVPAWCDLIANLAGLP